jgi:hypothetical protein
MMDAAVDDDDAEPGDEDKTTSWFGILVRYISFLCTALWPSLRHSFPSI